MPNTVVPTPKPTLLPVHNSAEVFPVRRIYCVGRNYSDHAREMGHNPDREPPFFFAKPGDAAVASPAVLDFPCATDNLHHEAELVVAIGAEAQGISAEQAEAIIWGYAAGNDLTRRDLQAEAKSLRRPWDMAKGFDQSAIIGLIHSKADCGPLLKGKITCHVDGELRQSGDVSALIWPVNDIIAHLSQLVCLKPGDLIMTGTPAGVGPIKRGQACRVEIEGLSPAEVTYR